MKGWRKRMKKRETTLPAVTTATAEVKVIISAGRKAGRAGVSQRKGGQGGRRHQRAERREGGRES
jgi:hypothetical protein